MCPVVQNARGIRTYIGAGRGFKFSGDPSLKSLHQNPNMAFSLTQNYTVAACDTAVQLNSIKLTSREGSTVKTQTFEIFLRLRYSNRAVKCVQCIF